MKELVRQGQKIQAIKVYREITGADLLTAKKYVEALEAGQPTPDVGPRELSPGEKEMKLGEIREMTRAGKKIEAIKRYREVFHVGLAEAKEAVERLG